MNRRIVDGQLKKNKQIIVGDKFGGCGEVMIMRLTKYCQWTVYGFTFTFLCDGVWWRLEQWKDQGYWVTWSTKQRFGERFGYEKPVWQIGKGKWFRIACFFLEQPGWSIVNEQESKKLRRIK